jgi:response regulator RpfG family c-di-GMP phosphodiesterase
MMTAYDDMRTTVEAIKLGAFEYLVKPLNYIDLDLTVAKAFQVRALEQKVSYLVEERQKARFERVSLRWLEAMTEEEKGAFIEATMPTGFKQMLTAFEQLPEEKRARAINEAVRRLREAQTRLAAIQSAKTGRPK